MVRLTRAQQQERTRATVLDAAREEFTERGYADAKVDRIAERAALTRGAVYSNFPSKRALYLAVLIESIDAAGDPEVSPPPEPAPDSPASLEAGPASDLAGAVGAFARDWLRRLPLTGATDAHEHLRLCSLTGVVDDGPGRAALSQVADLEALLLALPLESYAQPGTPRRRVRLAQLVLTMLNGTAHQAETAPGFGDPFDVAHACRHLADLDLRDAWNPPHLAYVAAAQPARQAWDPPGDLSDQLTGRPIRFDGDGVIAILGSSRLSAAEEAVRAARPDEPVTIVVVTSDSAEIGRLVRLRVGDLTRSLRKVFGPDAWPTLRIVVDGHGVLAVAAGAQVADDAEAAVRVEAGTIIARAEGLGAAHAVASFGEPATQPAGTSGANGDSRRTDRAGR